MDVSLLSHFQYAIPVGIVLIFAVLVFAFGFKNAEQPPFAQLSAVSDVDRKQANKKRNKIKEKVFFLIVTQLLMMKNFFFCLLFDNIFSIVLLFYLGICY